MHECSSPELRQLHKVPHAACVCVKACTDELGFMHLQHVAVIWRLLHLCAQLLYTATKGDLQLVQGRLACQAAVRAIAWHNMQDWRTTLVVILSIMHILCLPNMTA